jgi:hypothetical protein
LLTDSINTIYIELDQKLGMTLDGVMKRARQAERIKPFTAQSGLLQFGSSGFPLVSTGNLEGLAIRR